MGAEIFYDIRKVRLVRVEVLNAEKRIHFVGVAVVSAGLRVGLERTEKSSPGVCIKVVRNVPVTDCGGRLKPTADKSAFRIRRRGVVKALP